MMNRCKVTWVGHNDTVDCFIKLLNGKLVSGSDDASIQVWDTKKKNVLKSEYSLVKYLLRLNNNRFVSGSYGKNLQLGCVLFDLLS